MLKDYPNGTYAGFVEKQANADEGQEEGDADEDEKLEKELETAEPKKLGETVQESNTSINSKSNVFRSQEE